ncbi:hypothetical protein C5S29_05070 [ANME-1 cluster archaeon GoMg3.2]|nr:hypothetical protein [ANME-1 cluster archaeon GoMg3.2]
MKRQSLVLLIKLLGIVIFLSSATIVAGSDELKRELLEDILSQDKPELFDDYRKLDLAKTTMKTVIQGMSGVEVTSTTKAWVDISLGIIDDFELMVNESESSDPRDHINAVEAADRIDISINALKGYPTAERNGIHMLSELALTRFYRAEAKFFEDAARNTGETKLKIDYERRSSIAYEKGGKPSEASRMAFESRRNEKIYDRDMKKASEYINEARVQRDNATNPTSGFFGSNFMGILKARDSFEQAKGLYERHNDKELENVKGIEDEIKHASQSLMLDALLRVGIYLLILSFIVVILWKEFKKWGDDLDDTRLGEELIV